MTRNPRRVRDRLQDIHDAISNVKSDLGGMGKD